MRSLRFLPLMMMLSLLLAGCGGKVYEAMLKDWGKTVQIADEATTSTEFFVRLHEAGMLEGVDPASLSAGVVAPAASWEEFGEQHNGWCIVRPFLRVRQNFNQSAHPVFISRNISALSTSDMLDKPPGEFVTKGSHVFILDCGGMVKAAPTKGRAATPPFRGKEDGYALRPTPADLEVVHP